MHCSTPRRWTRPNKLLLAALTGLLAGPLAAGDLVARIDRAALEQKRPVNRGLAIEVMKSAL